MRKIAISLREDRADVLYARKKKGKIIIDDIVSLKREELDGFLAKEKASHFYLTVSFKEFYQNTLYIPPVEKKKDIKTLLKKELQELIPQDREFLFNYFVLGDRVIDDKKSKEIFVISVPQDEVEEIIYQFIKNKKTISLLHSDFLSLLNLVPPMDDPILFVFPTGNERYVYLIEKGKIHLFRSFTGLTSEIDDFDIQNINMTISYCNQRLKIQPKAIFIVGDSEISSNTSTVPLLPLASLLLPRYLDFGRRIDHLSFSRYLLPASALLKPRIRDFVTEKYRLFRAIKSYLTYSTVLMLILSVFLGYFTISDLATLNTEKTVISGLRSLAEIEALYNDYENLRQEMDKSSHIMDLIKKARTEAGYAEVLEAFSRLDFSGVNIRSIRLTQDMVSIEGDVEGDAFMDVNKNYRDLIEVLQSLDKFTLLSESFDINNRDFSIEGRWKTEHR